MKRMSIFAAVILAVVLLLGCAEAGNGPSETEGAVGSISEYFPIKENVRYVYAGEGNEYASYDVYNDYTSENRVQQRINNGGTEMVKVVEINDEYAAMVFSKGETYIRQNFLNAEGDGKDILLKAPIIKGSFWTLDDSRKRTITDIDTEVETPYGKFEAIEVVTEGEGGKTYDYYAKDVGLVKSVFVYGDTEVTSSLSIIEENVPLIQTIRFYYPDMENDKLDYIDEKVNFYTNDITRSVLAEAYKNLSSEQASKVLSENTHINSLYLNQDGMVYIDLNKAFLTEMNAGAAYEQMILQSIANTFGRYFGTNRVILTIDNELYESGHIRLDKGEFIKVTDEDV